MSIELVLPTVIAVAFGAVAGLVRWPGRPAVVMRLLAGIAGVTAVTVLLVLAPSVRSGSSLVRRW